MTTLDTRIDDLDSEASPGAIKRQPVFATTHWSVVAAAEGPDASRAQAALERLCQTYWYPLYIYVRRRGYQPEDAQDLTQEFFSRLLKHHWLAKADRAKGRFRSFLLLAIKRFLANEWDKVRALKRGGGAEVRPLVLDTAEVRYVAEPASETTPELEFERNWARALLETVLALLGEEYAQQGKYALFEALKPCLVGTGEMQPYAALAAKLELSEGAVKVATHRLRRRYRERLKEEIATTVAGPEEVEVELRHLYRLFAGR